MEGFVLQWGRGFVAAEIRAARCGMVSHDMASMGPRLCSRGNGLMRKEECGGANASMGPRLCSRGNRSSHVPVTMAAASFNGAAAL